MKKEQPKLSELVKEDFERTKKKCLELWYSTVEKHTKANTNLVDNPKYIKIAEKYKPFQEE